jgi:hypothetical protein
MGQSTSRPKSPKPTSTTDAEELQQAEAKLKNGQKREDMCAIIEELSFRELTLLEKHGKLDVHTMKMITNKRTQIVGDILEEVECVAKDYCVKSKIDL